MKNEVKQINGHFAIDPEFFLTLFTNCPELFEEKEVKSTKLHQEQTEFGIIEEYVPCTYKQILANDILADTALTHAKYGFERAMKGLNYIIKGYKKTGKI